MFQNLPTRFINLGDYYVFGVLIRVTIIHLNVRIDIYFTFILHQYREDSHQNDYTLTQNV